MKKYQTILADPPWKYGKGWGWGAGEYYELLKDSEIAKLPVNEIADANCHLYLWSPNAKIESALKIMLAWGFKYKTMITWAKHRSIFGYYFKGQTEHLLFGVRGKLPPLDRKQTTLMEAKIRKHSQKPDKQYKIIELVSPSPRIELFARQKTEGWDVWGNEVESDIKLLKH